MILGLILALASALGTNVAFLFKHRGAVLAPPIRVRHPLRSAADLFGSRWFAVGWIVAIFAWGLHVGALSLAPLSIVQAVLSGGLVFLAVVAERFFGFQLGRRQWLGVTITAAGLVVIGLTGTGANTSQRASLAALIAVEGAIFALGAALVRISTRRHVLDRAEGLPLGAAAGALFGVSDVAIKYLTKAPPGPLLGAVSPWTLTALTAAGYRLLCLRPKPPTRRRRRGHRAHFGGRQPRRDHRGHPRLPRADRLRRPRHHRPLPRVLPRHRRRRAHARPDARHPRAGVTCPAGRERRAPGSAYARERGGVQAHDHAVRRRPLCAWSGCSRAAPGRSRRRRRRPRARARRSPSPGRPQARNGTESSRNAKAIRSHPVGATCTTCRRTTTPQGSRPRSPSKWAPKRAPNCRRAPATERNAAH
jgi:drug/metabolite transporter (DMT)-like permease